MKNSSKSSILGIIIGLAYGIFLRLIGNLNQHQTLLAIMSIGFLVGGPLAIGWVSIHFNQEKEISTARAFFLPSIPILLGCLFTFFFRIEGLICIVMYLPLGIVLAGVGGLIAKSIKNKNSKSVLIILALPFAMNITENNLNFQTQSHIVNNSIVINASPSNVWNEIKSVRTIQKDELMNSWVHQMGFPRPLDAEIDKEGIGGIRTANFERGLQFVETVNQWEPNKLLSFKIEIDPKNIPAEALDEHVTIGGPYFDVLHGTYEIENLPTGQIKLNLRSEFRLSTHFNFYASIWTDLIMHQIQSDILSVIKNRTESLN